MVMNLYLAAPPSGIDVTERGDNRVEQQAASCDVREGYLGETGQSAAGIDQWNQSFGSVESKSYCKLTCMFLI